MKKAKKGFTLVELVIVVAVMAVLVAVAIPTVSAITKSAQDSVNQTNAQTIESMIKLEQAELSKTDDQAITDQLIFNALYDAKLGIKDGVFLFDSETGICTATTTAPSGEKQFKITYSSKATDDPLTVLSGKTGATAIKAKADV